MKTLCITGADNSTLAEIAAPFYRAGMAKPKTLMRDRSLDFSLWHQKVISSLVNERPIGRLWENLAVDLLLANIDSDCWGWYEAHSVDALEFWAELEPSIHFLLVCTRPEQELAIRLTQKEGSTAEENPSAWLDTWYAQHQKMLQFYLNHSERCLLIDANDALQQLGGQLAIAHEQWQLPLDASRVLENSRKSVAENIVPQPDSIASLIICELIKASTKDITGLYSELQAAQYPFPAAKNDTPARNRLMEWLKKDLNTNIITNLFTDYRKLRGQLDQKQKLVTLYQDTIEQQQEAVKQAKQENQVENELLLQRLYQVQEELESTFLSKQKLQQQLEEARVQQLEASPVKQQTPQHYQSETLEKNELLLVQLHQVQRELEHCFLEQQNLAKQNSELIPQVQKLKQQLHQAENQVQAPTITSLSRLLFGKNKTQSPKLKYEQVRLHRAKVNSDYEHLWISLKSLSFGVQYQDDWQFRLSCANVRPGQFGNEPKLEFPQQGAGMFANWFEENRDEYGSKLELRFATPNAMDMTVWKKLNSQDQQLITELIQQLPKILSKLQQSDWQLGRNWSDWQKLAADVQCIHQAKVKK